MTNTDAAGRIRRLVTTDLEVVAALWGTAVGRGEGTWSPKPPTLDEAAATLLGVPARFESYVYDTAAGVIGWGGLVRYHEREAYGATAELTACVAPEHRGRGVGRALVRHALARAPELDFHTIVLLLQPEPAYLLAVAARLGFRCTGRLTSVLLVGTDARDVYVLQREVTRTEGGHP